MNEDIQFLKDLQKELNEQDTDWQAAPRYWALMDYKWEVTAEGHEERTSLYNVDGGATVTIEEYIKEITDGHREGDFTDEEIEELKGTHEYESDSDVFEWINENDYASYYAVPEREVSFIVPDTMFLTKAEAKRHIELNHYHYSPKVHTYAMTAWRAPKVERLLKILSEFDFDSIKQEG